MSWFGADFPGESFWFGFKPGQDAVRGLEQIIIAGGAAGALALAPRSGTARTATGASLGADVNPNDLLISVFAHDPAAGGAGVSGLIDLTGEFTISAVDEIDNTGGTATTGMQLIVTIARSASQFIGA